MQRLFKMPTVSPVAARTMADRGLYFSALSPGPGTGLNTIAALAAFADVSPFITIQPGLVPVMLDRLRLTCVNPGTGGTALRFAVELDTAKADPTGGTQLTLQNVHSGDTTTTSAKIFAGPLTAAAAIAARMTHHSLLRPVIPVIGDQYIVNFGPVEPAPMTALPPGGVANTVVTVPAPPVVVQPGFLAQLHIWLPGQTVAGTWELELLGYEYPPPK